ncbi:hypothetical protein BLA18110_01783 [Burkholderia lata]|uniref:VIT1/CCC1 transporter family protein n=1 Tax=Burkholderia lata (strain ATCC 17760 / DSM 23089 / LMG 22485 / NCIMB 9086 / R18194 / 383) TaxID=482957 RepID=UPI001453A250|nr:VIT1/CCC1 transporter family protein [Burkholderia lata]VWC68308.1 hypothetical protein BLA18110_01783 [Burkholderia lata]
MNSAGSPRHVHRTHRSGWLRAAVLGANDGVLSMASLMVGMASAGMAPRTMLTAGIAGLAAGMLSMSAGEYVSVSSQADVESADTEIERRALQADYAYEQDELADIYVQRGLDAVLARQVAEQLMARDALAAHARDDIGISSAMAARPIAAAATSLVSFAAGGVGPLLAAVLASPSRAVAVVVAVALAVLAALGAAAARLGGAQVARSVFRVLAWGALTMLGMTFVGRLLGAVL